MTFEERIEMEPPEDLLGWEDARWGMSTAELDAAILKMGGVLLRAKLIEEHILSVGYRTL